MKKILSLIIAGLIPLTAAAQVTRQQAEDQLIGLGMPGLQADLVAGLGTGLGVVSNNEYQTARNAAGTANINVWKVDSSDNTVINSSASDVLRLQLEDDAQRLIDFSAASDTALAMKFGDGGTTAAQALSITSATADADDDSQTNIGGGGAIGVTRGAGISLRGNEHTSGPDVIINSGQAAGGDISIVTNVASAGILLYTDNAALAATLGSTGELALNKAGGTIAIQEATAGSKCMGTATANGTTAVTVSTTCATTGSRILLTRSSAPSGTAICWQTNIVNGVSFDLDCSGAETGTFDWFILHEAA